MSVKQPAFITITHPKTFFVTRLSEEFMVKAKGGKGSEVHPGGSRTFSHRQRRSMDYAANRSRKRFCRWVLICHTKTSEGIKAMIAEEKTLFTA